jgi:hypothetical protein
MTNFLFFEGNGPNAKSLAPRGGLREASATPNAIARWI